MKLYLIILVVFIGLEAVVASSFTRLLGSALVVQKRAKKDATKANVAHSKSKKIKVTPADQLNEAKVLQKTPVVVQSNDVGVQNDNKSVNIAQRQDARIGRKDLFLTVAQMLLSRFILKVNYKDPKSLLYARASFVAYLILFQALIWLLKYQINKRDDNTILAVNPSAGMDSLLNTVGRISGKSAMTNTLLSLSKLTNSAAVKTLTVKVHDLEHIQKLSSKLYFDLATTSLLHYLFGFQSLVLLTPMRGLASLLKNQLVLLHVFRFKPVGKLARPFKTPLEEFISSLTNPKTPAVSPMKVESADTTKESAKSSDTAARVETIAQGIDTVNVPTVTITSTVIATETEVEEDTAAESDEEETGEEPQSEREPLVAATEQEPSSASDASCVSNDAAKSEVSVQAVEEAAVETTDNIEQGGEEEEEEEGEEEDGEAEADTGGSEDDATEDDDAGEEEGEDRGDDENDVENEEEDGDVESEGDDLDNRSEGEEEEDGEGGDDEDESESEGESEGEGAEVDATEEDLKDDDNEDNGDGNDEEEEEEGEEGAEGEDTELLNAIDQLGEYP